MQYARRAIQLSERIKRYYFSNAYDVPVLLKFLQIARVPFAPEINVIEYFSRRVHLSKYREHLLIDKGFKFTQIHIEILLQSSTDVFRGYFVEVNRHHDLL